MYVERDLERERDDKERSRRRENPRRDRERETDCVTHYIKEFGLNILGDRHKGVAVPEWLWDLTRDYVGFVG